MQFQRRFTTPETDIFAQLSYRKASSEISNPDGTIVFSAQDIEVPDQFSQVATDILAQKYFRKAGVPTKKTKVKESGVPSWLQKSKPSKNAKMSGENDSRQTFDRLAGTWTHWGWKNNY